MTASPNVINIHAYCGNSGIFEYAYGGDMEDMIWYSDSKWNSTERLIVAYQVATAIADVHTVEENGRPSIAHTDITTSQFVYVDGRYKLNDFNRCRFIAWNQKTNEQCGFFVSKNPGHVSTRSANTV
jgi:tRNA A-37 threonylcarbamoyl transferase component Bud32